jgi:hypothetical protein
MKFDDEPVPGFSLPILPGHSSPGRLERVLRAGRFAVTAEIAPPDSADPDEVRARLHEREGAPHGVVPGHRVLVRQDLGDPPGLRLPVPAVEYGPEQLVPPSPPAEDDP